MDATTLCTPHRIQIPEESDGAVDILLWGAVIVALLLFLRATDRWHCRRCLRSFRSNPGRADITRCPHCQSTDIHP